MITRSFRTVTCLAALLCCSLAVAQPANDTCATPTALVGPLPITVGFDNSAALTEAGAYQVGTNPGFCTSWFTVNCSNDIWYTFVAATTLTNITTCPGGVGGTHPDTKLEVYTAGACANITAGNALANLVACDDDGCATPVFHAQSTFATTSGDTYLVRLGSFTAGGVGNGTMIISALVPLVNDECSGASDPSVALAAGNHSVAVDTTAASTSPDPGTLPCSIALGHNFDVWIEWTAHHDMVNISWTAITGIIDPVLAVYADCASAAAGNAIDCDDRGNPSQVTLAATVGNTYIIRVASDAGGGGVGSLVINGVQAPPTITCDNPMGDNYDITLVMPATVMNGDAFAITSNEPTAVNPIYSGIVGTDPLTFSSALLPANAGALLQVTFTASVTTTVGTGSVDCQLTFNPLPGDECSDAVDLGSGDVTFLFNNTGATTDGAQLGANALCTNWFTVNCFNSLYFTWTATTGQAQIELCDVNATNTDTKVEIYSNSCPTGPGTLFACDDDGCATPVFNSLSVWNTTVGDTYMIRIGSFAAGIFGQATCNITALVSPVTSVTCSSTGGDNYTVNWIPPVGALATDTIEIYSDEPGAPSPLAMVPGTDTRLMGTLLPANSGQGLLVTFTVIYTTTAGSSLPESCSQIMNPIPNDTCASAITLMGAFPIVATANLAAASASGDLSPQAAGNCQFTDFNTDAFFLYTATTNNVTIEWASAVMSDPVVSIHESCVDSAGGIAVDCNDGLPTSTMAVTLTVGQQYVIRVADDDSLVLGPGTLTIDAECFDITDFTATFDCTTQVVTLAWTENDNYNNPMTLTVDDGITGPVPTATQPVPVGLGGTNGQVETMPPLNSVLTYTLTGTCANGGSSTVSATIDTAVPVGMVDNLIIDIEVDSAGSLVDSSGALRAALTAAGETHTTITDQDNACIDQLIMYACRIWCVGGTFPDFTRVEVPLGTRLHDAVVAGKAVYMEGGDHWGFAPVATPYDDVDGVTGALDGGDDMDLMQGVNAPIAGLPAATTFLAPVPYTQDQVGNDWTDQFTVGLDVGITSAEVIWSNSPNNPGETAYTIGVVTVTTTSGASTINTSAEFGGFGTAAQRSTLLGLYLAVMDTCVAVGDQFQRGDCNDDGAKNIADPVRLLNFLFPPMPPPTPLNCDSSCDANDDGGLNIADAVAMLNVLFPIGPPIAWLAPDLCGVDPTMDALTCVGYTNCP